MKRENKPPPKEIELFDFLVRKYGTGEKTEKKINGYRNLCIVATVKIFPSTKNGGEKNKAALFLHVDTENHDYAIVFCSSVPKNDNEDRKLIEIRPSAHGGEPNINFGETGCGSPRVMRIRSSHDEFAMRARMIAFDIAKDINYLIHSPTHEGILMLEKETEKV